MKGFIGALTGALVLVLTVGGLALTVAGGTGDGSGPPAEGVVLTQVEDETVEESTEEPAATVLAPIEQLLAMLSPSVESSGFPSAQRVVLSRDPFRPVVPEPSTDGGGGTDGGGTDGEGTDGDGTDGGGTDGGGTDGDGTDGDGTDGTDGDGTTDACTGDEQEAVCDGVVVTLDGFTEDGQAIVTVNGTVFTVTVDEEFAESFRVLAINDPCATLLFGDEAFSICTGATVLK